MPGIRPLLLSQSDSGGAGNAVRRIHDGLLDIGVDSQMVVRDRSTSRRGIHGPTTLPAKASAKIRPILDDIPLKAFGNPDEFSLDWLPDRLTGRIQSINPDLVHLNWVAGGYMSIESLGKIAQPIVWRLPDMWALTGGCHYSGDCDGYTRECGHCPQLGGDSEWDLSRLTMKRKQRALSDQSVTVVATSSWLADCARESSLFSDSRIEIIPNGLNTDVFKPRDPSVGRDLFGLPHDEKLILFGAVNALTNDRKGADLLESAVQSVSSHLDGDAAVVIFGNTDPEGMADFDIPAHSTGYLRDTESLAMLYSAADVMVVPSRYEGFGQTVTESMACGTPVVAFDATGPSDTVDHRETGYLATPYEAEDLATGIEWILEDDDRRDELGNTARERTVERYRYTSIAAEYLDLYRSLL